MLLLLAIYPYYFYSYRWQSMCVRQRVHTFVSLMLWVQVAASHDLQAPLPGNQLPNQEQPYVQQNPGKATTDSTESHKASEAEDEGMVSLVISAT